MKIGVFTDAYTPQINGVVTSITTLEKELIRRGHEIIVAVPDDPAMGKPPRHVVSFPSMPCITSMSHRMATSYPPALINSLLREDLDIIHTHTEFPIGILGGILARNLNIPHIHTYHTTYEEYLGFLQTIKNMPRFIAKQYSRFYCEHTDQVIAPSEKTKKLLLDYNIDKPIHIIPTGLDFSTFTPNHHTAAERKSLRKEWGVGEKDPLLISIGRISAEKSLDVLLNAMPPIVHAMPNAKMILVGDGPAKKHLETLSKSLHMEEHIIFAGERPWADIGKYYRSGDLFISASQAETQGLTHLEAMASHTPVCLRKDPSFHMITHNKNGFFFQRDQDAATVIIKALQHPQKDSIIAHGLETLEAYTATVFADKVEALYYSSCNQNTANLSQIS